MDFCIEKNEMGSLFFLIKKYNLIVGDEEAPKRVHVVSTYRVPLFFLLGPSLDFGA